MRKLKLDELGRPDLATYKKQKKNNVVVVLDNIRSAMNVGSVFRTCDAFAVERIILSGYTAQPPHREITKTAIGATESVEWEYSDDVIDRLNHLRQEGYSIYSVEQTDNSETLMSANFAKTDKLILVFGNEVSGVSDAVVDISDGAIEIEQFGTKHSLNVSVCAGIVLWKITESLRG